MTHSGRRESADRELGKKHSKWRECLVQNSGGGDGMIHSRIAITLQERRAD